MIQLHPPGAPAVPSIPAMPDFRVGGISSRYFNLQGIRDRLQVKTPGGLRRFAGLFRLQTIGAPLACMLADRLEGLHGVPPLCLRQLPSTE